MLAKNNEALRQAAETTYVLSADEQIRLQCEAREEYYRDQRYMQKRLEKAEKGLEKAEKELEKAEKGLEKAEKGLEKAAEELQVKDKIIQQQNVQIQKLFDELELLKKQQKERL